MLMIGVTASDRGHRLRITHTPRRDGLLAETPDYLYQLAIPEIKMLCNLSCPEMRFELLFRWLHSRVNVAFTRHKLYDTFIYGMAY